MIPKVPLGAFSLFSIILFGLGVLTATVMAQTTSHRSTSAASRKRIDTFRQLDRQFARYELKPVKVIRNQPDPVRSSRRKSISIGRHKVEWINEVDAKGIPIFPKSSDPTRFA